MLSPSSPSEKNRRAAIFLWLAGGFWLLLVGLGFWLVYIHAFTPGASGRAADSWPASSPLPLNSRGFSLVVAAHPECPCSRATVDELEAIMIASHGRLAATVLVLDEPGLPEPAEQSDVWRKAAKIPGVTPVRDPQGREIRRFGALTSGETRLYGPQGELLFHGGITASRGHAGDNPGESAVRALISGAKREEQLHSTPVFGCALFDPEKAPSS